MSTPRIAAVLACAAVCVGCATGVTGTPVAELWDPCTVSGDALMRAGIDPADFESDAFDQGTQLWKTCTWDKDWFVLTIYSTTNSLDAVRENAEPAGLQDIDISGRAALTHTELPGTDSESCFVSFATGQGAVEVEISDSYARPGTGDFCTTAIDFATRLESELPE